jgi:hypothetical protein
MITSGVVVHPRAYTLVNLLPFTALGWLCLGIIAAGILRARQLQDPGQNIHTQRKITGRSHLARQRMWR